MITSSRQVDKKRIDIIHVYFDRYMFVREIYFHLLHFCSVMLALTWCIVDSKPLIAYDNVTDRHAWVVSWVNKSEPVKFTFIFMALLKSGYILPSFICKTAKNKIRTSLH